MSAPRTVAQFIDSPPAHTRVLGTPGSGKTTLLVERYHALVAHGHHPLVIAFGREQRDGLLERVIADGTALLGPVPVTTHGLLASNILDRAPAARARTLRDVDERVVLDRVLARLELESDLRAIAHSAAFRDDVLNLLHALLQNGVSTDAATRARGRTRDPRARDVLHLYGAYRTTLDDRGLVTFYDAAWAAARALREARAAAPHAFDVLLIDDFHDLDRGQFALIQALAPPEAAVAVEVFGDPTGARFGFRGTSDRFLTSEFAATYRATDVTLVPRAFAPVAAPKNAGDLPLFAAAAPAGGGEWARNTRAREAADEIAEAQQAALVVRDWLSDSAAHQVAVIALDADAYRSVLLLAFEERGVRVHAGGPGANATDELIRAIVGVLGRDADGRFLESLLSSPLWPSLAPTFGDDPVRRLRAAAGERGETLETLLREHVLPPAREAGDEAVSSADHAIEEWRRYREVSGLLGGSGSYDEFRDAYLDAGAPRAAGAGAVCVLSPREAAGRAFARAVVVGCADGVFAREMAREGYLPVGELARALGGIDDHAAEALARRVDREASLRTAEALLLTALTRAHESLVVLSPRKLGGEVMTPAPQVRALFDAAQDPLPRTVSPALAVARALHATARSEAAAAQVRAHDKALAWRVSPEAPARLPKIPDFRLSPSGMETYSDCARKFFYSKVLYLDDPESIFLAVGGVFHDVMKRLVKPGMHREQVVAAVLHADRAPVIDAVIADAMTTHGPWIRELTRIHVSQMLDQVATVERSRSTDFIVASVEQNGELKDGERLLVRGRLDRVDEVPGVGSVVIDYKTSGTFAKSASKLVENIESEESRGNWQVPLYAAMAADGGTAPAAFLYYVVPVGAPAFATGLQLSTGSMEPPVPLGRRPHLRFLAIEPASIVAALDEAFQVHADITAGHHPFPRTDDVEECKRCDYRIACRRSNE